jgi:hypothetical protein
MAMDKPETGGWRKNAYYRLRTCCAQETACSYQKPKQPSHHTETAMAIPAEIPSHHGYSYRQRAQRHHRQQPANHRAGHHGLGLPGLRRPQTGKSADCPLVARRATSAWGQNKRAQSGARRGPVLVAATSFSAEKSNAERQLCAGRRPIPPCDDAPMEPTLSETQAFEAMRLFLAQFNEREPEDRRETIALLLAWTEIQSDGVTDDPAQWEDWKRAVADARAGKRVTF